MFGSPVRRDIRKKTSGRRPRTVALHSKLQGVKQRLRALLEDMIEEPRAAELHADMYAVLKATIEGFVPPQKQLLEEANSLYLTIHSSIKEHTAQVRNLEEITQCWQVQRQTAKEEWLGNRTEWALQEAEKDIRTESSWRWAAVGIAAGAGQRREGKSHRRRGKGSPKSSPRRRSSHKQKAAAATGSGKIWGGSTGGKQHVIVRHVDLRNKAPNGRHRGASNEGRDAAEESDMPPKQEEDDLIAWVAGLIEQERCEDELAEKGSAGTSTPSLLDLYSEQLGVSPKELGIVRRRSKVWEKDAAVEDTAGSAALLPPPSAQLSSPIPSEFCFQNFHEAATEAIQSVPSSTTVAGQGYNPPTFQQREELFSSGQSGQPASQSGPYAPNSFDSPSTPVSRGPVRSSQTPPRGTTGKGKGRSASLQATPSRLSVQQLAPVLRSPPPDTRQQGRVIEKGTASSPFAAPTIHYTVSPTTLHALFLACGDDEDSGDEAVVTPVLHQNFSQNGGEYTSAAASSSASSVFASLTPQPTAPATPQLLPSSPARPQPMEAIQSSGAANYSPDTSLASPSLVQVASEAFPATGAAHRDRDRGTDTDKVTNRGRDRDRNRGRDSSSLHLTEAETEHFSRKCQRLMLKGIACTLFNASADGRAGTAAVTLSWRPRRGKGRGSLGALVLTCSVSGSKEQLPLAQLEEFTPGCADGHLWGSALGGRSMDAVHPSLAKAPGWVTCFCLAFKDQYRTKWCLQAASTALYGAFAMGLNSVMTGWGDDFSQVEDYVSSQNR